MSTLHTRLCLKHEIDDFERVMTQKWRDTTFPRSEQITLEAMLRDRWQHQLRIAFYELQKYNERRILTSPQSSEATVINEIFSTHLSGSEFTDVLTDHMKDEIRSAFVKGKKDIVGKASRKGMRVPTSKDLNGAGFGVLFGYTEQHAVEALKNILRVSVGGFWDNQMSEIMLSEMDKLFRSKMSRTEFMKEMERVVNERLVAEGKGKLATSYFKGVTGFLVAQTRSFGKSFQMSGLNIKKYSILNPRDLRTAPLCKALSKPGKEFEVTKLQAGVNNILGATSLDDLKNRRAFVDPKIILEEPPGPTPFFYVCRCTEEPVL